VRDGIVSKNALLELGKSLSLSLNTDLWILYRVIYLRLNSFKTVLAQNNGYCSRNRQIGNKLSTCLKPLPTSLNITQLAKRNANITQLRKRVSFDVILSASIKLTHPLA